MKAMLIVNPSSGKEEALNYVNQIEELLNKKGYEVKTVQTEKELDAMKFCQNACRDEFEMVVSLGGDGTLNETINGMVDQHHRPKLGVVPLGTVNDFARALNIPLDAEEAVNILSSDRTKKVDIGRMNDHYFVNIVAIGAIAEASYEVTPEQKTKFGSLAYIMEGLKTLASTPDYPLYIEHDEQVWEGNAFLFLAALTNSTAGFEQLAPQAKVNDGLMHCYIVKKSNVLQLASLTSSMLKGELRHQKGVEYFTARSLKVSSSKALVTNVDGEEGDPLPAVFSVKPQHIEVIVE
ncbi:diacylglycerol/lipid kinase family protein [Halobacillus ihumii]|uniref:diacylglycerol/lipid kinase family protein n=1 Tax=Halobacillus ihumii TaxID=2686092 RepID=UPI0013D2F90A|nr:diacylglycerol kinase family protein [Halobacillus ihumii]